MATKTKTTEPTVTKTRTDLTADYHRDYGLVLTLITIMVKAPRQKASFEYEIELNGDSLGIYGDRYAAEAELRAAAMKNIEDLQAQQALVELEAAAGVPEAIEELNQQRAYRSVISYIPFTDQFGLYLNGNAEPFLIGNSYLEVEHAARKHYDLDPLPF